jgi:hypothetical protein
MIVLNQLLFIALLTNFWLSSTCACDLKSLSSWATERLQFIGADISNPCSILSGGNASLTTTAMRKDIQIFLFQKDEKEVLPDWLQYHSFLFGVSNIHVIDHNSTNDMVCKTLALYSKCGAKVTSYNGSFKDKRNQLTGAMLHRKSSFLIPLDVDEFIVSSKKDIHGNITKLNIDRNMISNEILHAPIDGRKYKFGGSHAVKHNLTQCNADLNRTSSVNISTERRVLKGGYAEVKSHLKRAFDKTFFYSDGFISTDQGNHFGAVKHDKGTAPGVKHIRVDNMHQYFYSMPSLVLLHYTATSYVHLKEKYIRAAKAYGFGDDHICQPNEHGTHYCKQAKHFREEDESSRKYYRHMCGRESADVSVAPLTEWVAKNTLSIEDLVGA